MGKKFVIIILSLFLTSCQFIVYERDGLTYAKGSIGLGIVNKKVPNLIEFDVPVKDTKVISPVLEDTVEVVIEIPEWLWKELWK